MKSSKIILVSSAVVFSLMLGNLNAFAASPAENNLQVQKALNSLRQGLETHKTNLQIVVGSNTAKPVTIAPKSFTAVKYNRNNFNQNVPQPVINNILISGDNLAIGYDGIINYNIVRQSPKIFVMDIINPVYTIGAQNYKPDQNGNILNAVVAYYTDKSLYGYPYLRIAVYLKKQVPYALGSANGSFVVYFGNNAQQEINQQQQLQTSNTTTPVVPNNINVNTAQVPATVNNNAVNTTVSNGSSINDQQPITLELIKKINQLESQIKELKTQQQSSDQDDNNTIAQPQTDSVLKNEFDNQSVSTHTQQSPIKQAQTVDISLKNISCIKSPYPVSQVIYSKEDSLQIQVVGNDVFVKILPLKIQNYDGSYKYKYSSTPRDIYIVTNTKTFSLNLVPKNEPAVTYYLSIEQQSPVQSKMANLQTQLEKKQMEFAENQIPDGNTTFYSQGGANEHTNNLIDLIKNAYIGKTPSGYILMPNDFKKEYSELSIKGEYKFVGQSSIIYVYKIIPKENLNIDPSQFVWLVPRPMAATIINTQPKLNESTQLILVGGK